MRGRSSRGAAAIGRVLLPLALSLLACHGRAHKPGLPTVIAHALGGIDHQKYLNCRECFLNSYARGLRFMEIDLSIAQDGKLVAFHDGLEKRFGLPKGFSSTRFKSLHLLGKYTPLVGSDLAALLKQYPDVSLVTDVKTGNVAGLTELCRELREGGVDCRKRVVAQLYAPEEFAPVRALGFERMIITLYRMKYGVNTVRKAVALMKQHREVIAITMPASWWWSKLLDAAGAPRSRVYVHTIDSRAQEQRFLSEGAAGVYSDFLRP